MKAEPDKKRAISIIAGNLKYADAPRNLDRALDAACAPVVKQRDELLAEVEKFGEYVESVESAQQRAGRAEQLARELLAALNECDQYNPGRHNYDLIRRATEQLGETT